MDAADLKRVVDAARCRVVGWQGVTWRGERAVAAALIPAAEGGGAGVLCQPSLAQAGGRRSPDLVLIDPVAGAHVIEVKGVRLDQVLAVEAGGVFRVAYRGQPKAVHPFLQARDAMFSLKDAVERRTTDPIRLPFFYWVALPAIGRRAWLDRFGDDAFAPPGLLFADDLPGLVTRLRGEGHRRLAGASLDRWPAEEVADAWRALGDSTLDRAAPSERPARPVVAETLGSRFDELAEAGHHLSDEQQELATQDWSGGPRLIRGVAGSGKTVVLAVHCARRLCRALAEPDELPLFPSPERAPRILVLCFNRQLVQFLDRKIGAAYRQRSGGEKPPDGSLTVTYFNELMHRLKLRGLWSYRPVMPRAESDRARDYLRQLEAARRDAPDLVDALAFDAIYVDEGQDFLEDEFRLMAALGRPGRGGPDLFVFYDDAQNLYGRPRPNWANLGLAMRGRSTIMTRCFRNPRPVLDLAFNVLYGSCAGPGADVPTREFADLGTLEDKGLVAREAGRWAVRFAPRDGPTPRLTLADGPRAEAALLVDRLRWLIDEQEVRPEDILVLTHRKHRLDRLADAAIASGHPALGRLTLSTRDRDHLLGKRGHISFATVAAAKGYDAFAVLLASAHDFPADRDGRVTFYVGCTRAVEHLEIFAACRSGLVAEVDRVLAGPGGIAAGDRPCQDVRDGRR